MLPPWVKNYVGIPFVSGGRDRSGCDCYGLVRLVLEEQFKYRLPLLDLGYKNACSLDEMEPVLKEQLPLLAGERIGKAEPGSVAVIRFAGRPSHVGLFVDGEYILHTLDGLGAHCIGSGHGCLRVALE